MSLRLKPLLLRVTVRTGNFLNNGKSCTSRIVLYIGTTSCSTRWKAGTCNPQWQETIDLQFKLPYRDKGLKVELQYKRFFLSPVVVGHRVISLNDLIVGEETDRDIMIERMKGTELIPITLSLKAINFGEPPPEKIEDSPPLPTRTTRRTEITTERLQHTVVEEQQPSGSNSPSPRENKSRSSSGSGSDEQAVIDALRETLSSSPAGGRATLSRKTVWTQTSTPGVVPSTTMTKQQELCSAAAEQVAQRRTERLKIDLVMSPVAYDDEDDDVSEMTATDTMTVCSDEDDDEDDDEEEAFLLLPTQQPQQHPIYVNRLLRKKLHDDAKQSDSDEEQERAATLERLKRKKRRQRKHRKKDGGGGDETNSSSSRHRRRKKRKSSGGRRIVKRMREQASDEQREMIDRVLRMWVTRAVYRKRLAKARVDRPGWAKMVDHECRLTGRLVFSPQYHVYLNSAILIQSAIRRKKIYKMYEKMKVTMKERNRRINELEHTEFTYLGNISILYHQFYMELDDAETWKKECKDYSDYTERIRVIQIGIKEIYDLTKVFYDNLQRTKCARNARQLRDGKSPEDQETMLSPRGALAGKEGLLHQRKTLQRQESKFALNPSDTDDCTGTIGDVFSTTMEYFKCYVQYVNTYGDKMTHIDYMFSERMAAKSPTCAKFRTLVEGIEMSRSRSGSDKGESCLKSLLIMPVQRIPRYEMLLKDILKHVFHGGKEYQLLAAALVKVQTVAEHVNQAKMKYETNSQMTAIRKNSRVSTRLQRSPSSSLAAVIASTPRREDNDGGASDTEYGSSPSSPRKTPRERPKLVRRLSSLVHRGKSSSSRSRSMVHQDEQIEKTVSIVYPFPYVVEHIMHDHGVVKLPKKRKCKLFIFDSMLAIGRIRKSTGKDKAEKYEWIAHLNLYDPKTSLCIRMHNGETPGEWSLFLACTVNPEMHIIYFSCQQHMIMFRGKVTGFIGDLREQSAHTPTVDSHLTRSASMQHASSSGSNTHR